MQRQLALITGATSGIGAEFARAYAKQNYDLLITGRREEQLNTLAHELQTKYGVEVEVVIAELGKDEDLTRLLQKVAQLEQVAVLVNNAGFGSRDEFRSGDFAKWETMLKVHNMAMMRLIYALLPNMVAQQRGTIINVASILAFFPRHKHVMYTATKAFMALFTETLAIELRNSGIALQVLCPGLTVTEFHGRMGLEVAKAYRPRGIVKPMLPAEVVRISLKNLSKGKVICIPGLGNKLIVWLATLARFFCPSLLATKL